MSRLLLYAAVHPLLLCHPHGGPRVPAGSRSSLRPLSIEGEAERTTQSSGEMRRESDESCLHPPIPPSSPGLTGRSSIPETVTIDPIRRGVLDSPLSRAMTVRVAETELPTKPSLRGAQRRSNPESLRGKTLDCFASLAMTRRIHWCVQSPLWCDQPTPADDRAIQDSRNRDRAARQAVTARSAATKQSRIPPREDSGLLRCAGNDDEDTWVRPITARVPRTLCFAAHPRHATVRTTPPWATSRRHSL